MPKKETPKDSTTDFFLKFITRQKEEKEANTQEDRDMYAEDENTMPDKATHWFLRGINLINILFDKILSSVLSIRILSFVITIVLVFVINGGAIDKVLTTPTGGDILKDVPVNIVGLSEDYVVSGLPETTTVLLLGPTLSITSTKVSKNYEVYVDLTNVKEGENTVKYQYSGFSSALSVYLLNDEVPITISKAITKTCDVQVEYVNDDLLMNSKKSVSLRSIEHEKIEARGSLDTIGKIHTVKVEIDLSEINLEDSTFTQTVTPKAYDRSGNEVPVDFPIDTIDVECLISSGSKEVKVVPNVVGTPEEGIAIADIKFPEDKEKIIIYGREEDLKDIDEISVIVNVEGLVGKKENGVLTQSIDSHIEQVAGVNRYSFEEVIVAVTFEKSITREIPDVPIIVLKNDDDTLKAAFAEGEEKATIRVTGAESIIGKTSVTDYRVVIDIENFTDANLGEQEVEVTIEMTNSLLYCELISKKKLIITLER